MDEDARAVGVTASVAAAADRFLPDDVPFVVDAGAGTAGAGAGAFGAVNFGAGTATVAAAATAAATAVVAVSSANWTVAFCFREIGASFRAAGAAACFPTIGGIL